MTDDPTEDRPFKLFLRYGLIAEPPCVANKRRAAARLIQWFRTLSTHRFPPELWDVARLEKHKAVCEQRWLSKVDASRQDIRNYSKWAPSEDEKTNLIITLAIAHREPGFEFRPPQRDLAAEHNWARHNLLSILQSDDPSTGLRRDAPLSVSEAARIGAKIIVGSLAQGRDASYGRVINASALRKLYSNLDKPFFAALKRERDVRVATESQIKEAQLARAAAAAMHDEDGIARANTAIDEAHRIMHVAHLATSAEFQSVELPYVVKTWVAYKEHYARIRHEAG